LIDHYDWAGGREAMYRFGPRHGPVAMLLLPLFEEHNRTRTFAVALLRRLGALGIAAVLPDLPGTGESLVETSAMTLEALRHSAADLAAALAREGGACFTLAIRSGALLDTHAEPAGRWHFAPQSGPALLRELGRIRQAEGGTIRAADADWHAAAPATEIAGNLLSATLLREMAAELDAGGQKPRRIVRLESDPAAADLKVPGTALWRQAEPGEDAALAQRLAADIADWVRACAG